VHRHYYLAKITIVVIGIALAVIGSGMGSSHVAHSLDAQTRYGAAAQVQAAAWHATAAVGRFIAHAACEY